MCFLCLQTCVLVWCNLDAQFDFHVSNLPPCFVWFAKLIFFILFGPTKSSKQGQLKYLSRIALKLKILLRAKFEIKLQRNQNGDDNDARYIIWSRGFFAIFRNCFSQNLHIIDVVAISVNIYISAHNIYVLAPEQGIYLLCLECFRWLSTLSRALLHWFYTCCLNCDLLCVL